MERKYVILRVEGIDFPVIFPKELTHKWVDNGMIHAARRSYSDHNVSADVETISAGFWDGDMAYGKSESLGLSAGENDSKIIKHFLGME